MASKLHKVALFQTPVCFATISVDTGPEKKTKTSKGINPGWNESFEFDTQTSSSIKIAVFRRSSLRSNVLIGEAFLYLKDMPEDKIIFEDTYQLCKNGSQGYGNIAIRLELITQSQNPPPSRKSETLATTSKEPGEGVTTDNPAAPELLSAEKKASLSATKLSHSPSSAQVIIEGAGNVKAVTGNDCFNLVCGYIEKLTNMGDVVSEIHPYAKAAWSILGLIPKVIIAQLDRDQNIQSMWSTATDMLDFLNVAEPVIDEIQKPIVANMLKQIHDCALFVQEYAGKGFCKRALRDTSSSESDSVISQYVTAFQLLKEQFKLRSSLSKLKVFREVREGLVEIDETLQSIREIERNRFMESLPGAALAGAECDENQACLPNTRVLLLDEIMQWVDDPGRPQYFWLHGPAGAGKSTVANTVAAICKDLGRLGASFSFKRDIAGRNVPDLVIGNLAYQLALFSKHFREKLFHAIENSGNMNRPPLRTQLKKYIIAPLTEVSFSGPMVIVIDALDECVESTREEFLKAWSQEASHLPAFVKVIFVSRYEDDIRAQLGLASFQKGIGGVQGTAQDILAYIDDQMRGIHQRHPELPLDWPSQAEKEELGRFADGLFIWVKVACDYIRINPDPIVGLCDMLSGERWLPGAKPEDILDKLYLDILHRRLVGLPGLKGLNYFQYIIGSVVVAKKPLTHAQLDSLLGLCPSTAKDPLKLPDGSLIKLSTSRGLVTSLSSILRIDGDTVRLLHASVADLLTDQERCTDPRFYIDISTHNRVMAFRCLETLQRILKRDPCGIADPTKLNQEIDGLGSLLEKFLSPDGWYACQSWHEHLSEVVEKDDELYDRAKSFLFTHMLHLIEVKSLQHSVDATYTFDSIFDVLKTLIPWFRRYPQSAFDDVITLLGDTIQFLRQFREPIMQSAAHTYISGIPFTASNTVLFKTFAPELSDIPKLCSNPGQSSRLITLPLGSAAVSPDCTRIVYASAGTIQIWDVETGTPIQNVTGHDFNHGYMTVVKFSPDGTLICFGNHEGAIFIRDAKTFKARGHFRSDNSSRVHEVSFTGNLKVLALYGDERICAWDIESERMLIDWHGQHSIFSTHLLGAFVVISDIGPGNSVFHLRSSPDAMEEYAPTQTVHSIKISSDRKKAAFLLGPSYRNAVIRIVDASTGDTISSWLPTPHPNGSRMSFLPGGERLVVWNNSTTSNHARFYDVHSGTLVRDVAILEMGQFVAVAADETRLLTWDPYRGPRNVKIFDLANGQQTATIDHTDITGFDSVNYGILPSGNIRVVTIGNFDVTIWNPALSESRPSRYVTSLTASPTSRQFAVAFSDATIELSDFDGNPSSCVVLPDSRPPFAFSPNGSQVVCSSSDSTLRCWNLSDTASMRPAYKGHNDLITGVVFCTNGTRLVTASRDGTIRIWDVESEKEIRSLPCKSLDIMELAVSLDESRVFYPINSGLEFRILDATSGFTVGRIQSVLPGQTSCWASFSPEGSHIVCVSCNGQSCLRDGRTGQYLSYLDVGPGVIDTTFSCTAHNFATIHELDVVDITYTTPSFSKTTNILKNTFGGITSLIFSFDGKYVLVGTRYGYVSLSDASQGVLLWEADYYQIQNMVFSSRGDKVAIVAPNRSSSLTIYIHETLTGTMLASWDVPHDEKQIPVEFSLDEIQVIDAISSRRVAPDIEGDDPLSLPIKASTDTKGSAAVPEEVPLRVTSPDGSFLANAYKEYAITLHRVVDNTSRIFLSIRNRTLKLSTLSSDGSILACIVAGKEIWIWNTMIPGCTICQHEIAEDTSIISIEISPDGEMILYSTYEKKSANATKSIFILDIRKNHAIACHSLGQDFEGRVAWIPGSNRVVTTSGPSFQIWDPSIENQLFAHKNTNITFTGTKTDILLSPNGTRMLFIGNVMAELWDIANYEKINEMNIYSPYLGAPLAVFSPHGKYIASYSSHHPVINIHDAFTGSILCSHYSETPWRYIMSLSFSMDFSRILVLTEQGDIVVWHIAESCTSMHAVNSFSPSHTKVLSLGDPHGWFYVEGKRVLYLPDTVTFPWASLVGNPRGLVLELEASEVVFLEMEDYLKAFKLGSDWSKGNIRYATQPEDNLLYTLGNLSQYKA